MTDSIFLGGGGPDHKSPQGLLLARANRHGLVAGATGTGKTVTLQVMAEQFSAAGRSGVLRRREGRPVGHLHARDARGQDAGEDQRARRPDRHAGRSPTAPRPACSGTSTASAAIRSGRPSRRWGRSCLSRLLQLNETQEGVITIAFQYADDNDLLLLDFKDLRSLLAHISSIAPEIQRTYGNVAPASDRRGAAPAPDAGAGRGGAVLRRAGAGADRLHAGGTPTGAAMSTSSTPPR